MGGGGGGSGRGTYLLNHAHSQSLLNAPSFNRGNGNKMEEDGETRGCV